MVITFEEQVLRKLSMIEERLSNIEGQFDDATSLASSMMGGEMGGEMGSLFDGDTMNNLKNTLSSFMSPQMNVSAEDNPTPDAESLQDLVGSLQSFRDRLSGIRTAIADMPEEASSSDTKGE